MASVELSADVPISPQDTWDHVSELSELGEWLVIHEGWRSELPDQLGEGVQIVGVARAMGMRNRVTWRVTKWDPPHEVAMTGSGKGGTKYGVTLTVRPTKGGSALGLRLELGGVRCSARWVRRRLAPSRATSRSRLSSSPSYTASR